MVKHTSTLWDIEIEKYNHGVYRYPDGTGEPPSIEVETHKTGLSIRDAVKEVWALIVENTMEFAEENLMAKEWEKEEEYS